MKTYKFNNKKHGQELLIDLGRFEDTSEFYFGTEPHTVDFYEIFFFRKANGVLQLDAQSIPLHDNLIVYATPFQRRIWQVQGEQIEGYFLIFANNFFELFFSDKLFAYKLQFFHTYQRPLFLAEADDSRNRHDHAFQRIEAELNNLQEDSHNFIQAFLLLILAGHNRRYTQIHGIVPRKNSNLTSYSFKKILEEQIRNNPKVEDLARLLGVSRITLNKQVKDKFGVTANQLIKERLLVEIERELLFSSKTISEIAFELNFSEPHHLIRFFKKRKDQTPAEFRATYQNGY